MMTNWQKHIDSSILLSKAFWLQLLGSVMLCLFEIGLTDTVEFYVIGMIVYVNAARMYLTIETPILAREDKFEAEVLEQNIQTLNILNVGYMVLVIFLSPFFSAVSIPEMWVRPTYLLFLFSMSVFAFRAVQILKARRNASESEAEKAQAEWERKENEWQKAKSELSERLDDMTQRANSINPEEIARYQIDISRLEKENQISAKVKGKSEKWDEISKLLNKPILRNNRYVKVVMRNGELQLINCTGDGTLKKKANDRKAIPDKVKLMVA